jgi:hypothetical protein
MGLFGQAALMLDLYALLAQRGPHLAFGHLLPFAPKSANGRRVKISDRWY